MEAKTKKQSHQTTGELEKVAAHIPPQAVEFVGILLDEIPCTLVPVKVRRTKHGDHRPAGRNKTKSLITINVCGNACQFLLTLLHELAHAVVHQQYGWRTAPHGRRWQDAFRKIVKRAVKANCFPADVVPHLLDHVAQPPSSSFRDIALQKALRAHDTHDTRPFVADLLPDAVFSLDGRRVFHRGRKLRTCYECVSLDGVKYRVAATARVEVIY
jgi:SprT protein